MPGWAPLECCRLDTCGWTLSADDRADDDEDNGEEEEEEEEETAPKPKSGKRMAK